MTSLYVEKDNINQYEIKNNSFKLSKNLKVEIIDNGIILPTIAIDNPASRYKKGGVINDKFEYIQNSGWYRKNISVLGDGYIPEKDNIKKSDEIVMYAGICINHYGHFMLESTTRLWWYLENREKYPDIKIVFISLYSNDKQFTNYQIEFFKLLGIENNVVIIDTPTQFKQVIVPEYSSILEYTYSKEFLLPFDYINEKIQPANYDKVYFSKRQMTWNKNTIGEDKIEKIFKKLGFKIFYPEKLSLKEQVSLIKGAKYLAGLSGSACHNAIYAKHNLKTIILNRYNSPNSAQLLIDKARHLDAAYVDVGINILPVTCGDGPFIVDVTENLNNCLKDMQLLSGNLKLAKKISEKDILWYLRLYADNYTNEIKYDFLKSNDKDNIIKTLSVNLSEIFKNIDSQKLNKLFCCINSEDHLVIKFLGIKISFKYKK